MNSELRLHPELASPSARLVAIGRAGGMGAEGGEFDSSFAPPSAPMVEVSR